MVVAGGVRRDALETYLIGNTLFVNCDLTAYIKLVQVYPAAMKMLGAPSQGKSNTSKAIAVGADV